MVAVLAGGAGERIGGEKARVSLGGRPLVCHVLAAAAGAGLGAFVVAKGQTALPPLAVPVVREPQELRHPLCGFVAALGHAREHGGQAIVAVACDMPFVPGSLLDALARLPGPAIVRAGGHLQPLLSRVPCDALAQLERALAAGGSLTAAIAALEPHVVDEGELARHGDPAWICLSVDSAVELGRAQRRLAGEEGAGARAL